MHFDPTQRPSSSSNTLRAAPAGTKRPFSQQAAAHPDNPPSSKAPRVDVSQRSPRRNTSPSPNNPSQQSSGMSSSRGQGPRARGGGFGFGFKQQRAPSPGPSFSKSQKKKFQKRLPRLEGPLHNEEYIKQVHKKSPLPLKPLHESTPKSSLGNFAIIAAGRTPTYTFTEGYITVDSGPMNVWRCVVLILSPKSILTSTKSNRSHSY